MAKTVKKRLTEVQTVRLKELEAVVDAGKDNWLLVGAALMEIRQSGLYLDVSKNFKEYCEKRFGFTDRWARLLMNSTKAIEDKSGSKKRNSSSASKDSGGGKSGAVKTGENSKKTESNGRAMSHFIPELASFIKSDGLSPRIVLDVANLAPPQQQVFLDQMREEGQDARTALAVAKQASATEANGKPEPVLDAEGEEVPSQAVAAFAVANELESIGREIDKIVHKVEEFSKGPGGRLIRFDSFKQQMRDAKGNLHANRATHVCPYCHGKNLKCEPCKGEGWTTKHIWHQAPGNNEKAKRS